MDTNQTHFGFEGIDSKTETWIESQIDLAEERANHLRQLLALVREPSSSKELKVLREDFNDAVTKAKELADELEEVQAELRLSKERVDELEDAISDAVSTFEEAASNLERV